MQHNAIRIWTPFLSGQKVSPWTYCFLNSLSFSLWWLELVGWDKLIDLINKPKDSANLFNNMVKFSNNIFSLSQWAIFLVLLKNVFEGWLSVRCCLGENFKPFISMHLCPHFVCEQITANSITLTSLFGLFNCLKKVLNEKYQSYNL